jgi:autotransporter-associated beta strand protein
MFSGADQISALRNITLAGDATIGGTGRWDARAVTGGTATLAGNGYDLTKVGANYIAVVGAAAGASITGVKNININSGTLSLANNITVDNNTPGSIFINSSGFLDVGNWGSSPGVVVNKPIVLAGGTVETDTTATGASGNATIAAGVTLNSGGIDTIAAHSTSVLTLNGVIADGSTNALTFTGTGTTFLGAPNTYDGTTTLNSGTLKLGNQNALQNSTLMMNGGALVFDSSVTANVFILGGLAAGASGTGFDLALQNNAGTPIALVVGGNNTNTIYAGVLK